VKLAASLRLALNHYCQQQFSRYRVVRQTIWWIRTVASISKNISSTS